MKIGIVTVYDSVSNIGSYLQAYAMQYALKKLGHDVFFVEKCSVPKRIWQHISKLNPKRAFFLRLKSASDYLRVSNEFKFIKQRDCAKLDGLLFGSDEIWNMDNPFFKDPLFFGTNTNISKIAYAVSVGAMAQETLDNNKNIISGIKDFKSILVRDERTRVMMGDFTDLELPLVCDPTLLVEKNILLKKFKAPKDKYILVYSYGVDSCMEKNIIRFAREKGLKIISAHFWHRFCDRIIACEPLQFNALIAGASYVYTSTFHGAIFAMLNHTQCAIFPNREKVEYVTRQMGQADRIVDVNEEYESFKSVLETPFNSDLFEKLLADIRIESEAKLEEALKCLED